MNDALCTLSLEDIAARIAARQVSPVEVTRAILDRIERLDPALNAYITVTADDAIASARAAEAEIGAGEYRGPLHGVPVGVKDLFATKGVRTTAGSKILADWLPDYDATVVARLRDAGAVVVGKLGLHEFAYGSTSVNAFHGDIHNPWDTTRIPGGSSGGSGAATAAALAYATLGSDTGGSIRMPAALCGCVGLMPTYGRVSLHGAVPLSWTLDHAGPLARTVRDAALALRVIAGHDPADPTTERHPVPDFLEGIERGATGLRIAVPRQYFFDALDPDVASLFRKALADLEGAGAEVREIEFAVAAEYYRAAITVMLVEAAAYHASTFSSRRGDYGDQTASLLDAAAQFTATDYAAAMRTLALARGGGADALLADTDVLAVPTCAIPAPTIASVAAAEPSARLAALTAPFDLTGQPVVAVPSGLTAGRLPASISFVARRWDEATALRAARAWELVRGPFPLPPIG